MTRPVAIGLFDSGVGGFSVLRHLLDSVGGAPLLYVADSAYAPYGGRTANEIVARSRLITRFLREQGADAVVVACNTATAVAVDVLRAEFDLPIIAMEPAIKPAARLTVSGRVAVLATRGTLHSDRYARLRLAHGRSVEVHERICDGWVEAVEAGEFDDPRVIDLVHAELAPLHAQGVDTYVLGCTHFPFLAGTIRAVLGDAVTLVDPGPAVAAQLRRRVGLAASQPRPSPVRLFTSGSPDNLQRQVRALLALDAACEALTI